MTGPLAPDDLDADSPFTLPGFFAALSEGRLLGATCGDCGAALVPPRPACYACGNRAVDVEEQPRSGTVVSHTEVRTPPPAFADLAPYTVAIVELDSGARLTGRVDAPYDAVEIGARVELVVREPTDAERSAALSYESDWPIHAFELV
ncbi:Zn-ribbon domain-containing OB-fold protein [Halomarina pelagica]|uniref:Zn-ribbon domain-containing OB-fold protein n=1 Tax=Halomarina pelagica TaxID=2961599 RepID=UPI0020C5ABE3|nr:Zn-ribbon domain-containing OB-fold protein [Halomarina sp. BND7]